MPRVSSYNRRFRPWGGKNQYVSPPAIFRHESIMIKSIFAAQKFYVASVNPHQHFLGHIENSQNYEILPNFNEILKNRLFWAKYVFFEKIFRRSKTF